MIALSNELFPETLIVSFPPPAPIYVLYPSFEIMVTSFKFITSSPYPVSMAALLNLAPVTSTLSLSSLTPASAELVFILVFEISAPLSIVSVSRPLPISM